MKKKATIGVLLLLMTVTSLQSTAQCPAGTYQASMNWDYLDYLVTTGNYAGFVPPAIAHNQNFTIGTNRLTIATNVNIALGGESTTHTGNVAGYAGSDVQYTPSANGQNITITFDTSVYNASFTLYDIDASAVITITGIDDLGFPASSNVTTYAGSILTVGIIPTSRTITATVAAVANNVNTGTATVTFNNLIATKSITIAVTTRGADPVFFLSDIHACVTSQFPSGYRAISRPFTGMPSYIITAVDSNFYMLDPATGRAKFLFFEPNHSNVNGMAYDPTNRILYYTWSLTGAGSTNRRIFKYDFTTETIDTVINNVNTELLIPTYDQGVESGSASFYNGNLYFGVESSNGAARNSGRENIVWRVDFDATNTMYRVAQVYAARSDSNNGVADRLIHDWSDIGVTNGGMLYDFDGARQDSMYYHFNMMTGVRQEFLPSGPGFIGPKQLAIDWNENVYNMGGLVNPAPGYIVPYNYNGTVNNALNRNVIIWPSGTTPSGSWGDCSEAFRPYCDFGDAPASYDPDPLAPAVHERDTAIRIGATFDREFIKTASALANADGADEDGLSFTPILSPNTGTYLATVTVYNNKGVNATLNAWLDYDGDGVFEPGEGITQVVGSSTVPQTRFLYWPTLTSSLPNGSYTYLRIRITSSAAMTTSQPTGYYENGETEDYRILVDDYPLPIKLVSFDAFKKSENQVELKWKIADEQAGTKYELEKGDALNSWNMLSEETAKLNAANISYQHLDDAPLKPATYYRLKITESNGIVKYSQVRKITFGSADYMKVFPNPSIGEVTVEVNSSAETEAKVYVYDLAGKAVIATDMRLKVGLNQLVLPMQQFSNGVYTVYVSSSNITKYEKLILRKN